MVSDTIRRSVHYCGLGEFVSNGRAFRVIKMSHLQPFATISQDRLQMVATFLGAVL